MSDFEYTHLVTGSLGGSSPHVTAACDAARHAAVTGRGTYRFGIYEQCEVTYQGGNDFRVGSGFLLFQGRQVEVPEKGVLLTAQNGDQGKLRHDMIVSGYEQADEGGRAVERSYLRYIKGTPSEAGPEDPAFVEGDLFSGAVKAETPLARIRWDGLTLKGVDAVPPVIVPTQEAAAKTLRGSASVRGNLADSFVAHVDYGEDLGTADYNLQLTVERNGVYGATANVRSKSATGFDAYVHSPIGYQTETVTLHWLATL